MNRISVIKYVFHAPTGFPTRAACTLREPQLASLNANRTSHRRNIRLKALQFERDTSFTIPRDYFHPHRSLIFGYTLWLAT